MNSNRNTTDWHTWIATVAGIIAILGFFGIAVVTDMIPLSTTSPPNTPTSSGEDTGASAVTELDKCPSLASGDTYVVSPDTYILGDISVDGIRHHDLKDEREGTVVFFGREATVSAEWGGGCYRGSIEFLEQVVQREFSTGCITGCTKVRSVVLHSDGTQVVQCHYPDGTISSLEGEGNETWCP